MQFAPNLEEDTVNLYLTNKRIIIYLFTMRQHWFKALNFSRDIFEGSLHIVLKEPDLIVATKSAI